LDDQVQMVALDRVVDDSHAESDARLPQCFLDDLRALVAAQVAHSGLHSHRDVDGMPRREILARQMRDARSCQTWMRPRPRPAGAFARATPVLELEFSLSCHPF